MKVFNINDSYFKYQKCFSGITYQFVNQLDNIYDKNLMVGENYCVYSMYNEYDIIEDFYKINFNQIDICSTINLDITAKYYNINGAYLKKDHKILLVGQNNPQENDIYIANSNGSLILSNELSTEEKSWRYKAYIKIGNNKGKQFYLKNSGNRFPIKSERKYFFEGHGYIIKNTFNYNIYDNNIIPSKLILTDYEIARTSLNKNYNLYNGFYLPTLNNGDEINIQYHNKDYIIKIDNDTNKYSYSGITSGTTIYNYNDLSSDGFGYETYIRTDSYFCSNASVYDYINFEINGDKNLSMKSFIKRINSPYIIISDYILDNILYEYYTGNTSTYNIINLMYSDENSIKNILLNSFHSNYFNISDTNYLYPVENIYNKYFDYDGLIFRISGSTNNDFKFTTNNIYIKYKLYDILNDIDSNIFNYNYNFLLDYTLSNFDVNYLDYREKDLYYTTYGDTKGTYIKITPHNLDDLNYFRKLTYANIPSISGKTLIVDIIPDEYMVIETYKSNSGITLDNISTIYNLYDISNILYDIYINDINPDNEDYYRVRKDNIRKEICNAYAKFISKDINIIDKTTAFLMFNDKNKFILKVYEPENLYNGAIAKLPTVVTNDNYYTTTSSAILSGDVIDDGGSNITLRGICYSNNILAQNMCVTAFTHSLGDYSCNIYPLAQNSVFYYKAFAQNEEGISYGNIYSGRTLELIITGATVTTLNATPSINSIRVDADVIDAGYNLITERGVVYKQGISDPNINDDNYISYTPESGIVGYYFINITGLTSDEDYSYNSYVINQVETSYGNSGYTHTLLT